MNNPLILSVYGGPGTGKSTTAALVFGRLKARGHNVELVHEFAKDMTWEKNYVALKHQPLITATQLFKYDRLSGQVQGIITDTSPILALIYGKSEPRSFKEWVVEDWKSRSTLNVFLQRNPSRPYNPHGRRQDQLSAEAVDVEIAELLTIHNIPHYAVGITDNFSHIDELVRLYEKYVSV